MQTENLLPDEVIDISTGRKIKILPPSPESLRYGAEAEQRMQELEAAGFSKEEQEKALNTPAPGCLRAKRHIHAMANLANTALQKLKGAGCRIPNENKTDNE